MKALVFNGVGNIALKIVDEPTIQQPTDAIVKLTATTICGTDLHAIRGTIPSPQKGTTLGHEGVGVVEKIGTGVHAIKVGDRVIVPSTIGCGHCSYCLKKLYAQCDNANPCGRNAGTAYYGGPASSGGFNGMQAEKVRVPFADVSLVKLPATVTDAQAILLSDILPTAYMGVEMAHVQPNDTVAVFGCGPVGQLVIACLKKMHVKQIFAIDHIPFRLQMAAEQGAKTINFDKEDPATTLKKLTNDKGPTKVIDAVGIDAEQPHKTIWSRISHLFSHDEFKNELKKVAPKTNPHDGNWIPGNGPSQALRWAVESVAKAGIVSIIGVYPGTLTTFPIGQAMDKNLTVRIGNCNHRAYFPLLLDWVEQGTFNPLPFITQTMPFDEIMQAYKHFDKREDGWLKVLLVIS